MKETPAIEIGKSVITAEVLALTNLKDSINQSFQVAVDMIDKCEGHVIITGMGKSGHIGKKMAATFASTGTPSFFVHCSESLHGDLGMFQPRDLTIALSHSGMTEELVKGLTIIKETGLKIISITSDENSHLAKLSDLVLLTGVEQEADPRGQAPTSSAIATLALGDALAIAVSELRGFTRKDFLRLHPGGTLGKDKK